LSSFVGLRSNPFDDKGGTPGVNGGWANGAYEALGGAITQPAWRTKPSWYLITTEDKMIPPDAQHAMSKRAGSTVVEVKSSHAVYVSHPQAVAHLIEQASTGSLAVMKEKP
jgi:hypothetical protein